MPKMKTKRAAAKRFKITGTGRVRRPKGGASHFMAGKPAARLRRLRKQDMVHDSMEQRVKQMLPYGTK
jgi:large subunit ribosomal protein L35